MKRSIRKAPLRSGFTLVELLVSMALTLFVMTILVEAFGAGMDTFQNMRGLGDVQDSLRSALNMIKADVAQDHFEGARKLSDVNFWDEPRREGFFNVTQKTKMMYRTVSGYICEGTDLDGVNKSFLATDHRLSFSMRARGNRRENFFFDSTGAPLMNSRLTATKQDKETVYGYDPLGSVTSQWGEITYVLQPTGAIIPETRPGLAGAPPYGPIRLYNLNRVAFLTIPYADTVNGNINAATDPNNFPRLSRNKPLNKFLSPNDFAKDPRQPQNQNHRSDTNEPAATALVCTNVVSFQIRIMRDIPRRPAAPRAGIDTVDANGYIVGYDDLVDVNGTNVEPFDSAIRPPSGYRLIGLQIVLRVFDPATGLTRQATLSHDL